MPGVLEVCRRMAIGGGIAAADMPADQAEPEVNPSVADRQAFGAAFGRDWLDRFEPDDVFTWCAHVDRRYVLRRREAQLVLISDAPERLLTARIGEDQSVNDCTR
jgi:hypothetical protein